MFDIIVFPRDSLNKKPTMKTMAWNSHLMKKKKLVTQKKTTLTSLDRSAKCMKLLNIADMQPMITTLLSWLLFTNRRVTTITRNRNKNM